MLTPLPIDPLLPDVVRALRQARSLVIEAPPGAGKTTRVPRALLEAGFSDAGEIIVLQPRRLPARLAAARVAEELGEAPGHTIGYTVRFDDVSGPRTRLRFVTEGVLTRRLLSDPTLAGVSTVILDEFHERHLAGDLALALLRDLQLGRRPDLNLCVMSATLDAGPVKAFLGDCPALRSAGRAFEVSVEYLDERDVRDARDPRAATDQIAGAVRRLCREDLQGDVLVFLPGAGDIRRAAAALEPVAASQNLLVLPLHGDLPPGEQDRAVRRASQRKVILSTNVAETSVTIDGVVAVIDTGLARTPAHSPWSRLPTLGISEISRASAVQRAGRAGRTRPGRALRLYTRHSFESRRAFEQPEIERLDLAETVLAVAALGVRSPQDMNWFEAPPAAALGAAVELLRQLGALEPQGDLSETGRQMLRFPLHPRLGRLLVEAERRGVGPQGAVLAALMAERDISDRARARFSGSLPGAGRAAEGTDLLERLDRFEQARQANFSRDRLQSLELDARAVQAVDQSSRQLRRALGPGTSKPPANRNAADQALAMATLAAFPDRVLRRRVPGGTEAILASGGSANVIVGLTPPDDLLVAVDVEERTGMTGRAGAGGIVVRAAVGISPDWLVDVCAHVLSLREEFVWNPTGQRVDRISRLAYGIITLDESRTPATPCADATRVLAAHAASASWGASGASAAISSSDGAPGPLALRLAELRKALPEEEFPAEDTEGQRAQVTALCEGRVSFQELREAGVETLARSTLTPRVLSLLRTEAPERWRLPAGHEVVVHYEADRPPWIESRLQDFFGMSVGPTICRGRVPLTLHLLAPNGRAVQVTRDLPNFWRQHYPALRRELGRRYPRHPWPEEGATATPPPPRPPRPPRR